MSVASSLPSEVVAIADKIDPDNYGTGTTTGAWVNAKDFIAFMAEYAVGDLGSSATFDAKIEQATDSGGSNAKDVSNSSISQLTQSGSDQSNQQAIVNVRPEDLDVSGGFTHIRLTFTVGTASSDAGATLYGVCPRHGPASDQQASTVAEIVTAG